MSEIELKLKVWKDSLCESVSLKNLYYEKPIVYKWKAIYRCLVLRETVNWRTYDLTSQAHFLFNAKHILGSRILIRSAIETIALIIHLNQLIAKVISNELDFHEFDQKTRKLLLGSRDGSTKHSLISVITILEHCEKKYKDISSIYATLSECAHPNYEGVCFGYSKIDYENNSTHFSNKWEMMWSHQHEPLMRLICFIFEAEYSIVWHEQFNELENWVFKNDAMLENTKSIF
jgi:hypothetical protein